MLMNVVFATPIARARMRPAPAVNHRSLVRMRQANRRSAATSAKACACIIAVLLRELFQRQPPSHLETEVSASGRNQLHECTPLIEAAAEQNQPRLQIVLD